MKKIYNIKFKDGNTESFYINDLSGYYYGELWIKNLKIISKNKCMVADIKEFKDNSIDGFMKQVNDFVSENFNDDYLIEEAK